MKIVKFAAIGFVALMVIGLFAPDDKPSEVAQETTSAPAAPAPTLPAPTPPAAPERPSVDGPDQYGDDPEFDALWDLCEAGDYEACEDLYWNSPLNSEYEAFALSSLNMMDEALTEEQLSDLVSADFLMDLVWDGMDTEGKAELCLGYGLLGGLGAGTIISESSNGTVTPEEAAAWLKRKCE